MILTVAMISPARTGQSRRDRRDGDRLVDDVDARDRAAIDRRGRRSTAARRFARPVCASSIVTWSPAIARASRAAAASSPSSPGSSRAHTTDGDLGRGERGDVVGAEDAALLDHARAGAQRVDVDRAERVAPGRPRRTSCAPRAARRRSRARIDTAISAGERAPIARPTGPCRRSSAAACAARRSRRAACVFFEPRQPM